MSSHITKYLGVATLLLASTFSRGSIISVTPDGEKIAPPAKVKNAQVTNTHQQGFDEKQGITLPAPLLVDGGAVPAGTKVDSHMIFLNQEKIETFSQTVITRDGDIKLIDENIVWTFSGPIVGVMSDVNGTLEAASTALLGAPGTKYPDYINDTNHRGFEENDSYFINGNQLTVNMHVTQPGDWIRVITATPDAGSSAVLLALSLTALAGFTRAASCGTKG